MNADRRFEQEVSDYLGQLSPGPMPDYRDDIVRQTARMRQRPAWTIPERWISMTSVTSRLTAAPRVPMRLIALAGLLIAALVVGGLLLAGSRPRVPAPFGPAANGSVAIDRGGDLYSVDPKTGLAVALTSGPDIDLAPVFAQDGTGIVFYRWPANRALGVQLIVADADGSHPVAITTQQHQLPSLAATNPAIEASYAFSPDGREVMFTAVGTGSGEHELWLAKADGSGERQINAGMSVIGPRFLPPDGSEIVFSSDAPIATGTGIYAVDVASGRVRTIVPPSLGVGADFAQPSPDGSRIAYSASTVDPDQNSYRVHVVNADGTNDIELPMPGGAVFQDAPQWSNDGSQLAVTRGYAAHNEDMVLAALPADGSSAGVETSRGITGCCDTTFEWSPDDSTILVEPESLDGAPTQQLLWVPSTGATSPAGWVATSNPAWQRRAP